MISNVTLSGSGLPEDHPLVEKLSVYVTAHRNYLESLDFEDIKEHKVNWGLRNVKKIDGPVAE